MKRLGEQKYGVQGSGSSAYATGGYGELDVSQTGYSAPSQAAAGYERPAYGGQGPGAPAYGDQSYGSQAVARTQQNPVPRDASGPAKRPHSSDRGEPGRAKKRDGRPLEYEDYDGPDLNQFRVARAGEGGWKREERQKVWQLFSDPTKSDPQRLEEYNARFRTKQLRLEELKNQFLYLQSLVVSSRN